MDSEATERTSLQSPCSTKGAKPLNPVKALNQKKNEIRDRKIEVVRKKAQSSDANFKIFEYCCGFCIIGSFGLAVFGIYYYYSSTYEDRDFIDHKEAVVHEKWKDFTTHELVNCSNNNPCRGWDCHYVREHFHKIPDECQYEDHMRLVTIVLVVLAVIAICNCIFG